MFALSYDTATGEFISRDPLGYVDGMSLYRAYFVPGGVDPSGRKETTFTWQVGLSNANNWTSGYHFPDIFGIDEFYDELVTFWRRRPLNIVLDGNLKSVAAFRFTGSSADDIATSRPTVSDGIKIHETIHYWNHTASRYRRNGLLDEKVAYGFQHIASGMYLLKLFEDNYVFNEDYVEPPCGEPCDPEMQTAWNTAWIGRSNTVSAALPGFSVQHNGENDNVGNDGWAEIERVTGIDISCSKLAEHYISRLNCRLSCPDMLPEVFR